MPASEPTSSSALKLKRRGDVETRPLPDGALLVDMSTGKCFRLNRAGAVIWGMLSVPHGIDEICRGIAESYGVPLERVDAETRKLVDELARERLISSEGAESP